jgi:predicted RNA-binding protein with PIN domain
VSRPRIIIDGYNLLHRLPDLARLADSDLERAREILVSRLIGYRATKNARITVVFDGRGPQATLPGARSATGVEIVFSRAPESADTRIKSIITREPSPRSCTVVTSDNSIRIHVRDFGAKVVSSAEFAQEIAGQDGPRAATRAPSGNEKPDMTPAEVADWEEYFRTGRR